MSPTVSDTRGFWAELKRRHVIRVVSAYIVIGVAVGGAADIFLPNLGAPDWVLSSVLVLIVLGLPIAAVIAWAYEVTPEGIVREDGGPRGSPDGEAATALVLEVVEADRKAIAVLPFANMSDDPENEYFSDGVMEDILTHLSRIKDLRVISRTSSMTYKGSNAPLGKIASELGVGSVLEGSVRKAGGRVRVTAQLIDATTDRHLWAETYDRELEDIFAVQGEVAEQIARALHVHLAPEELSDIRTHRGSDLAAYQLYVKGRQHVWSIRPEGILRGIEQLNEAVALDPELAAAHATLGFGHLISAYWGGVAPDDAFPRASSAAARALELDDRDPAAWGARAGVKSHYEYDWPAALEAARTSVRVGPSDRDAHFWLGVHLLLLERFEEALELYGIARTLDPHDPLVASHHAVALWCSGGHGEAERAFRKVMAEHPTFADVYALYGTPLMRDGRYDEFAEACRGGSALTGGHPIFRGREAMGLRRAGRIDEAEAIVSEVITAHPKETLPTNIRCMLALGAGDGPAANDALKQAVDEHQPMVLWYRVGRFVDVEIPEVRAQFARVWPEEF